jgi:phospholipid/cholesterol/gamma-HCH transport system substrate-binding protein
VSRVRLAAAVGAAVATLLLSGCGVLTKGVYDTPLPGGADLGSNPVRISADFEDVLDLVPQSSVKVDNVAVGRVDKIRLNADGTSARVDLLVNHDVSLPAGTAARIQQTSLLGEKYVALVRPEVAVAGPELASGARLGVAETSQAAQVEQVLGALSMVLNGGGIGQFQEISRELQQVSDGRPEEIKGFLKEMSTFVGQLDDNKEAITAALDGLEQLSRTLDGDKAKIVSALEGLSPGMKVFADQREQLVDMLSALDRLSDVTVETLDASQKDIIADFKALEPILTQLARSGDDLPQSLEILLTYPFPDSVLGAIKGDYLNVFITTNFRTIPADCAAIGCAWPQVGGQTDAPTSGARYAPPAAATQEDDDRPPTLLPPTSSPTPGYPQSTISVPSPSASAPGPSPSPSESPSASPTEPLPSPDDSASPTQPATTPTSEESDD